MLNCPHRNKQCCIIASRLAMVWATPTEEQCEACTNHPTLPQRINGIVCAVAKRAQREFGLEVDEKLIRCIHTEQTLEPETLKFLRNKWKQLHSYVIISIEQAQKDFKNWLEDIPKFGCTSCASEFEKILEKFPPNFSSQELYFEWTVFVHNEVNKSLFKDEFPLEKAKENYGYLQASRNENRIS